MCKRLIALLGLVMMLCVACVVEPPVENPNCPPPVPNCDGSQP